MTASTSQVGSVSCPLQPHIAGLSVLKGVFQPKLSYESTKTTTKAGVSFGKFAKYRNSTEYVIHLSANVSVKNKKKTLINASFSIV